MKEWVNEREFKIDDITFVIDITPGKHRRPSLENSFTLVKTKPFLEIYERISERLPAHSHGLELGIFQGGSFVLFDKLIKPSAMSAIELSKQPVEPLVKYCESIEDRKLNCYFGSSASDKELLGKIYREDLGGYLEFVIDDASHRYQWTADSFYYLFELLAPGGIYIIEDWTWAFSKPYMSSEHSWSGEPSLVRLVFEIISNVGAKNGIQSVEVMPEMVVITKETDTHGRSLVPDIPIRQIKLPENL